MHNRLFFSKPISPFPVSRSFSNQATQVIASSYMRFVLIGSDSQQIIQQTQLMMKTHSSVFHRLEMPKEQHALASMLLVTHSYPQTCSRKNAGDHPDKMVQSVGHELDCIFQGVDSHAPPVKTESPFHYTMNLHEQSQRCLQDVSLAQGGVGSFGNVMCGFPINVNAMLSARSNSLQAEALQLAECRRINAAINLVRENPSFLRLAEQKTEFNRMHLKGKKHLIAEVSQNGTLIVPKVSQVTFEDYALYLHRTQSVLRYIYLPESLPSFKMK